jgi:hypothetical protein
MASSVPSNLTETDPAASEAALSPKGPPDIAGLATRWASGDRIEITLKIEGCHRLTLAPGLWFST